MQDAILRKKQCSTDGLAHCLDHPIASWTPLVHPSWCLSIVVFLVSTMNCRVVISSLDESPTFATFFLEHPLINRGHTLINRSFVGNCGLKKYQLVRQGLEHRQDIPERLLVLLLNVVKT